MFDYEKTSKENINCNLCGEDNFFVLANSAGAGVKARTCLCKKCGLIYINPRMTKKEYGDYYKNHYREDRKNKKGGIDPGGELEKNFINARNFGRALAKRLSGFINLGLALDVGSSTGGILRGLMDEIPDLRAVGIEPSADEAAFANQKGIKTHNFLFENLNDDLGKFSNILCVQSLNHLLDPMRFFKWSRENLKEGGHLILAVKNFRQQARRAGKVSSGVQIDHPYMFVPETLRAFMRVAGFKIVYEDIDERKSKKELTQQKKEGMHAQHIRLVGKKTGVIGGAAAADRLRTAKLWLQFSPPAVRFYNFLYYP